MHNLDTTRETLQRISARYDKSSEEAEALLVASQALIFADGETHAKFLDFLKNCDRDLDEREKDSLRSIGIDPDEDDTPEKDDALEENEEEIAMGPHDATLNVLERIFHQYDEASEEADTLVLAARALLFAFLEETDRKFLDFIKQRPDRDLTELEKHHLRSRGLDPDAPLN